MLYILIKNVKSWYFQDMVVVMAGEKPYATSSLERSSAVE